MADITMCMGRNCPDKNQCWRFIAPINEHWQAYSDFDLQRTGEKCVNFWQAEVDRTDDELIAYLRNEINTQRKRAEWAEKRTRELETEREEWEEEVGRRASVWQERTKQAEAERDALKAQLRPEQSIEPAVDTSYTGQIAKLRAERDTLRALLLRIASEVRYSDPRVAESIDAALGESK